MKLVSRHLNVSTRVPGKAVGYVRTHLIKQHHEDRGSIRTSPVQMLWKSIDQDLVIKKKINQIKTSPAHHPENTVHTVKHGEAWWR